MLLLVSLKAYQNFQKFVGGMRCFEEFTHDLADRLDYGARKLPIKYVGLSTGANLRSKKKASDLVVERFQKGLSLWKKQYLSFSPHLLELPCQTFYFTTYLSKRCCQAWADLHPRSILKMLQKVNFKNAIDLNGLQCVPYVCNIQLPHIKTLLSPHITKPY